MIERIAVI